MRHPLKSLFARATTPAPKTTPSRKLSFHELEDRAVPATLYVDNAADYTITTDIGAIGLSAGDTVTWNSTSNGGPVAGLIFGTNAFFDIPNAITTSVNTDTIYIAEGTFITTGQINVNKSITISGAGQDQTILKRSGEATGTEDRAIEIQAPNVTISDLTVGAWQNLSGASAGRGYLVWLNNAGAVSTHANGTTLDNVHFAAIENRAAVFFGTSSNVTIQDSRFTGMLNRSAIRGAGENMLITGNSFEEVHRFNNFDVTSEWYSSIFMEYNSPTSGEISYNYFAAGVAGNPFTPTLNQIHTISNLRASQITAAGLKIFYNTFDLIDGTLLSTTGYVPTAYYSNPASTASGPILVQDNIFQGYAYNPTATNPTWRSDDYAPLPGNTGSLEFDGTDDYATFQSPLFDIGTKGTLNFWAKMHNTGRRNQFFEGPTEGGFEFQYRTNSSGQFYTRMNTPINNDNTIQSGGVGATALNNWVNFQVTWDFATKVSRIYINGTEVTYLAGFDQNISNWLNPIDTVNRLMFVGRDPSDVTRMFDGLMDDIGWFDDVLNSSDLSSIRTGGVAALSADSRLVTHWDLDSTSGNIELDNKNGIPLNVYTSLDTLTNDGPTFRPTQGVFGGALEFDGLDDYGTFQSANFDVSDAGTLNFWIKANDLTHRNQFFEGPANNGFEFQYRTNSPNGQFFGSVNRGPNIDEYAIASGNSGVAANTDTWLNLQYTWIRTTPTAGELRVYVNGTEVSYASGSDQNITNWANLVNTVNGVMSVGRDPGDPTRNFDGLMDDIAWFDSVLNATDRATLISSSGSAFVGDPRLVAYWNLDNPIGTTTVPTDGGYSINLVLSTPVSKEGSAINASAGTTVNNNVFWNNDTNYNGAVTVGTNIVGDPMFAGISNGPATDERYALLFGSAAAFQGSGYPTPGQVHIGAYQDIPVLPTTTVYVNDDWTGYTIGTLIPDADDGTTGNQGGYFGYNAFATINDAFASVTTTGSIVVNAGTYNESVTMSANRTLEITGPDAAQTVYLDSLTTSVGQTVIIEGTSTFVLGDATSTTIAGTIVGTGDFVKVGTGTVTLTNTNTYVGTTDVNAGTLLVNGTNNGGGAVEVNSTATLGGTGTITGTVNGNASGTVSPGSPTATIGNLTTGSLDLDATSTLAIQISGNNNADRVTVTGTTVDVTGATLTYNLLGLYTPAIGHSYTIINNTGPNPVIGEFAGLLQGAAIYNFLGTGLTAHINYQGGDGNDVVISLNPVVVMPNGDLHVYGNNLNNVISYSPDPLIPGNVRVIMDNVYYGSFDIDSPEVVRTFGAGGTDTVIINGGDGNDTFTVGADVTAPDSLQDKVFALNGLTFTSHDSEAYQLKAGNGNDTFNVLGLGTQPGSVVNDTNVYLEGGMGADQINSQLTLADVGGNARTDWNILGPQRGNIEGLLTFNWVEEAEGNGLDDYFTFSNGASMPSAPGLTAGVVGGGGTNTMNMALSSTAVSVTFTGPNSMNTSQGPATGVNYLVGSNATTDRITGHNAAATWNITDVNDGTYNAGTLVTFENFETLVGGTGVDTFIFDADGRITGQLDGGSQGVGFRDVIDITARATAVTVTVSPPTIKEGLTNLVGSWSSVEEIQANPTNAATNNLTAANGGNTWTLTAANAGTLNALTFSGFGTLQGGTSTDNFLLGENGSATSLLGGSGTDTLSYAGATTAVNVNINTTTGGATGSGTRVTGFTGIDSVIGGTGSDTIVGTLGVDNIIINGATSGTINTSLPFVGFETVNGNDGNDTYTVTTTGTPIGNIVAGAGIDTLIGANRTNSWAVTSLGTGSLNGMTNFSGIENLTGGSGADTFNMVAATVAGTVNGGGNNDILQVGSRDVTLTNNVNGTATGGAGTINFVSIENLQSTGGSTLTGFNAANIWRLTGSDMGILNSTTLFSGFDSIVGGTGQDRLQVYQGRLTGGFNGGAGSDILDYAGVPGSVVPRPYNVTANMLAGIDPILSGFQIAMVTQTMFVFDMQIVSGNIYA